MTRRLQPFLVWFSLCRETLLCPGRLPCALSSPHPSTPCHPWQSWGDTSARSGSCFPTKFAPKCPAWNQKQAASYPQIFLNHLGASAEGRDPLLTHQTHPSGELCLWQPAEPSPDVPSFSLNAPQEHPASVPPVLPDSICFSNRGPLNGSFNPTAAGFLKRKQHSLTNENRV